MAKGQKIQEKILSLLSGKNAAKRDDILDMLKESQEEAYALSRSLKSLKESGLVERYDTEYSSFYKITPSGRNKLRNIKLSSENSLVSTSWDGFWRIVMIDIPESRKSERNSLRYLLKKAGFVALKNSVWISPLPLEHLFMNIKKDMGFEDEMIIIVTQYLDPTSEEKVLKEFMVE